MPLPTNLTTNEVKNSAGTEVEFNRLSTLDRSVTFAKSGESPSAQHRLKVSHQEVGSGITQRRRSVVRVDLNLGLASDNVTPTVVSAYCVYDVPIGALADYSAAKEALAELISFLASTGADTTIKYDLSGNGAAALLNGSL